MFCVDDTGRTLFALLNLQSRLSGSRLSFTYLKLNIIKCCLRQILMNGVWRDILTWNGNGTRWSAKQYCFIFPFVRQNFTYIVTM